MKTMQPRAAYLSEATTTHATPDVELGLDLTADDVAAHPDFAGHELVRTTSTTNLKAIIAVHNTSLGPAVGGCRMFPYVDQMSALTDVLRLSQGMTYKSALAGLPLGGGKAVILGDPSAHKNASMLREMGRFINEMNGRYVTAEDSGTGVADMAVIAEETDFVSGLNPTDRFGGDPSPLTAYGVFRGIAEAVQVQLRSDLRGVRVAIQGAGNVGYHLAKLLIEAGAHVFAADINNQNVQRVMALGVTVLSPADILAAEVEVLSPCAMGGAINPESLPTIRASVVAGAANNQLSAPEMASAMKAQGILYAPDYVINAGGIIDVYYQRQGVRDHDRIRCHIDRIADNLGLIFAASLIDDESTSVIADRLAEQVLAASVVHSQTV